MGNWERNNQQGVAATADRWQQVAQIYLAAVERNPEGRAAFLTPPADAVRGYVHRTVTALGPSAGLPFFSLVAAP